MKHLFAHRAKTSLGVGLLMALAALSANAQTTVGQPANLPLAVKNPPIAAPVANPAAAAPVGSPMAGQMGAPISAPMSGVGVNQAPYTYNRGMQENMDESTLLSEAAKKQARLALLNMNSKIEQAQLAMERDRLKFQEEQREAQSKALAQQAAQNATLGLTAQGKKVEKEEEPEVKPSVRSIYSYDGKWFAEIAVNGSKVLASPGTVLVGGGKVTSITSSNVVVVNKGKRQVLPLDGSAALSAQSVAPSVLSAPVSTPSSAPLPPIPPTGR